MADPVTNFGYSTLTSGINDTDTSMTVADASVFPDPSGDGNFNVVIWEVSAYANPSLDPNKEIVRVTAVSTNTFTITRAQESTSAANHNTGGSTYAVGLTITKKVWDEKLDEVYETASSPFTSSGSIGATETFDFASTTNFRATLDANTTITISNLADGARGSLSLYHDASAQRTIAWSGIDLWVDGDEPTDGPDTGEVMVVTLINDGASVIASYNIVS